MHETMRAHMRKLAEEKVLGYIYYVTGSKELSFSDFILF